MNNVMIDIETLGKHSRSVITTIAAVSFDIETGEIGKSKYIEIDINDSIKQGLEVDGDTIIWWLKQPNASRKNIHSPKESYKLKDSLSILTKFLNSIAPKDDLIIWGNSAKFDLGILSDAYRILDFEIPWIFYNERCVRTLAKLKPNIKKNTIFDGVRHNPIDDCLYQIKYCHNIWVELFPPKSIENIYSDIVYELKIKIPREYVDIGISNNVFYGKTESNEITGNVSYKLPDGDWVISRSKGTIITLKNLNYK